MGVSVAAPAAQGPKAPAFRIRVVLPGEAMAAHGIDLDPLPLLDDEQARRFPKAGAADKARIVLSAHARMRARLRELGPDTRTVLVQRQIDLLPTLALERSAAAGRRLVLDIDDAIWHDADAGGHPLARLKGSGRKVAWLARRAEVVVAGNDLLATHLAEYNDDVRVIPSLVDVDRIAQRTHVETDRIVLGWIGSPTTVPFLDRLRGMLERAAAQVRPTELELLVVGGEIAPVPGIETTVLPWSEAAETEALARMDIGLMPLPDTPFTRGKCAYKALQYMAAGIPVVADDVGVSATVIGDRGAGLIARDQDDWIDAVQTLSADTPLRGELGAEGRRRVSRDFSYERWIPELAAVLRGG